MPRGEHLAPFLWGVQAGLVNWKHRQYDARREGNGGIHSFHSVMCLEFDVQL